MGKRLQMAPTGEYILWAEIPDTGTSTFNRAYGPFVSRSAAYSVKTALIKNKRAAMKHEGYKPEEIEAEIEAIKWATTGLWDKVNDGQGVFVETLDVELDSPIERAAEAMWNNQGAVIRGVRAVWKEARDKPEWAHGVQRYRNDARLALEAAAGTATPTEQNISAEPAGQ